MYTKEQQDALDHLYGDVTTPEGKLELLNNICESHEGTVRTLELGDDGILHRGNDPSELLAQQIHIMEFYYLTELGLIKPKFH